ncbi:MAG: hypothetical protein ABI921_00580 [Panacibacter sp.]
MVKLKLRRDEARYVDDHFFPFMLMNAKQKLIYAENDTAEFNAKVILSLISDVIVAFKRKLLSNANKFVFNFSNAHAICFYYLLLQQPIQPNLFYDVNLRQHLVNVLHKIIINPVL